MKLYDKKFLIYENCMIRSFGQPGQLVFELLKTCKAAIKINPRQNQFQKRHPV